MKTALAIFVLAALMTAPIACVIVVCPALHAHDCCPKSKSFAACPFDILDSAKAALPAVVAVVFDGFVLEMTQAPLDPVASFSSDERDLHLHNRILRI